MHSYIENLRVPVMAPTTIIARGFMQRFLGLIPYAENGAPVFVIPKCRSVHTCFMRFPIDIIFVDRNGKIVKNIQNVSPFRFLRCPKAEAVIEYPSRERKNFDYQKVLKVSHFLFTS